MNSTASVTEIRIKPSLDDVRIARYAALAIALSVLEAGIPSPIPGIKPGLANIITLIALWRFGWRDAAWISMLRIIGSGIVLGGFLSPGFAMSLMGGLSSLLALAAVNHLPRRWFGPVSHSLVAAFAHMAGQLLLARLWLIPHNGIIHLVPLFAAAALVFGVVNGVIAAKLLARE
ncbi:Gx transporter family protein [Janthinobacterium sp. B9-8]|uniref:Gx transporter family protein n=1 Tax=Janthinobacterium sp. B9-8 TaxID=1236179 RepID=UPI00061D3844|nr:Gx transporter family protein [Janthinobacterium sp. B9-8]AMC36478.1 heptaprenyl diphosphate synthase [Janthinobacterium sp. B9-8]